MSFLRSHVSVLKQYDYDSKYFSGFNPYALGFAIFTDIKRICNNPTAEDRQFFPDMAGTDWAGAAKYAMANFKDDSFILQYLSPKVARDFKMFHLEDRADLEYYSVDHIHNESGFHELRHKLSKQYDRSSYVPNIQVTAVDLSGNRTLTLEHKPIDGISLSSSTAQVTLDHVAELWEFPVELIGNGEIKRSYGRYSELELDDEEKEESLIIPASSFY
jgi:spore cortex formation protein SpoVR/YcgB (stage V sporulation)